MSHQAQTSNFQTRTLTKNDSPIRNLGAFLKSYMKSESAQRALTRQASFIDRSETVGHGKNKRVVQWREYTGDNSIALALDKAFMNVECARLRAMTPGMLSA